MLSAASLVLASAAVAHAASSYIPSGISSSCSTFLASLDSNTDLAGCTSTIAKATSAYAPGGNASTSATKDQITATLDSICPSVDSTCPSNALGQQVSAFYVACKDELVSSPNAEVKLIYDTVYTLRPLVKTVCSTGDDGSYCLFSSNTSSALGSKLAVPSKRDDSSASLLPNGATIGANNLVFLSLFGTLPKDELCTSCTRSVATSYISFESSIAYAPGLAQSVLMGGQIALMKGIATTCGADFLTSAAKAAGGLATGSTEGTSAAVSRTVPAMTLLALAAGAVAALL